MVGALAGKTVIAAFTPLCALALLSAGRRFYSTGAGVAAALLYVSIPWVASTSIIPSAVNVLVIWTGRGGVGVLPVLGRVRGGAMPGGQVRQ